MFNSYGLACTFLPLIVSKCSSLRNIKTKIRITVWSMIKIIFVPLEMWIWGDPDKNLTFTFECSKPRVTLETDADVQEIVYF